MESSHLPVSSSKEEKDQGLLTVEELAAPFNLTTDGNPFDMDAILDAIPMHRRGIKYTDGWDPSSLDEELKNHPFFMKELPADGEALHPLVEALQQLKYSEDDNTPLELALNYKEDGIFHFKIKKYRVAIACFTEALRKLITGENEKSQNQDLIAQLYNNRAAAQFHLQNYRSCLIDCRKSIEYKSDYFKPVFKAIEAAVQLKKWTHVLEFCELAEKLEPTNSEVQRLRLLALRNIKLGNAVERKSESKLRAKLKSYKEIMYQVMEVRKIACRNPNFLNEETEDSGRHVRLGEDGRLEWAVLFCYPQYSQSDIIEAFHEDSLFSAHLQEILDNEPPSWDTRHEYNSSNVKIYYINFETYGYETVDSSASLVDILQSKTYELPGNGIPTFFVMANNEMCNVLYERVQSAAK